MMYGRRRIIHAWHRARAEFVAVTAERDMLQAEHDQLKHELQLTQRERNEFKDRLVEMLAARHAVAAAETYLQQLYREREIRRAEAVERDASTALN